MVFNDPPTATYEGGIDDTHRFFAGKDEIPHKVYASGVAFDPSNTLVFDHGTHVAGTIGGCAIELTDGPIKGAISGVAPAAELWDYTVTGPSSRPSLPPPGQTP